MRRKLNKFLSSGANIVVRRRVSRASFQHKISPKMDLMLLGFLELKPRDVTAEAMRADS
jgi:hypothetical protein